MATHGVVGSRGIAALCREHVTFIALCGDDPPHFTTIADFVSTRPAEIAQVFTAVVAICDREGLIGREMFAIDGVQLPSNAWRGSRAMRPRFARGRGGWDAPDHGRGTGARHRRGTARAGRHGAA